MPIAGSARSEIHGALREHWDERALTYDDEIGHGKLSRGEERAWRHALTALCGRVDAQRELHVLDVGTGTGVMARLMAAMGHRVTGVDLSPAMLDAARARAEERGQPATYVEGRADALPFEDGAFDLVFSRHLLWT
ncbi:MAG: class I SAM-dependent methyltransferase, partial [Chloroflexota bacterium]